MESFFKKIVLPLSKNEDLARSEFILNVLLVAVIGLSFVVLIMHLVGRVLGIELGIVPVWVFFVPLSFFTFLYFLSRTGHVRLSSYGLLISFFLPVTYQIYIWGVDIPAALLSYVMIIFISGILINKYFTFVATAVISLTLATIGYFQVYGVIRPNLYWKTEYVIVPDIIIFVLLLFIIATVSWLSNREIEKSLARARRSEADLKKERDSLEVTVETRTRELKETQAEQMTQLYRFAEFGRISSGLFHDLINPLNAVSLNIEKLKSQHVWLVRDSGKPNISLDETSGYLERAVSAARRLENMVTAVRKQLAREETRTLFLIEEEIRQVIDVLAHKAQKANVELRFMPRDDIKTLKIFGDAVKFNQVMLNLIANGIDACMSVKAITINRWVQVSLVEESEAIIIGVEDNGVGISEHHIDKIFEPFFTTKATRQGIGIGLSVTKRIVEQNFSGTISVESTEGKESVFTVKFPQKQNE